MMIINEPHIFLPEVFHFRFTDCCEDFTPMLLVEDNRKINLTEPIGMHGP